MGKPAVSMVLWMVFAWMQSTMPVTAEEVEKSLTPLVEMSVSPTRIDWLPAVDAERWVLTFAGPGAPLTRREFKAGQAPFLGLSDSEGDRLPDGSYAWELRVMPRVHAGTREELPGAREAGAEGLSRGGRPEQPLPLSGSFTIKEGSFVKPSQGAGAGDPKPPLGSITAKDSIETGNMVVKGKVCFGASCSNTDATFPVLKLKSSEPGILFDDIALPEGGPTSSHDWALFINYLDVDRFSIVDFSNGLVPFSVAAGAPDNSLYLAGDGKVGIGTAVPSSQLHVFGNAGTNRVLVEEANGTATTRSILELRNNGGPFMGFTDTSSSGKSWAVGSVNNSFMIVEYTTSPDVELNLSNAGNLTIKGVLTQGSDRFTKREIVPVEPKEVLAKLAKLPISTWNRETDLPSVRHMGPMAQDFAAIFGLGEDDRHIATLDMAGVSIAAIQALNAAMDERDGEVAALRRENADLGERIKALEALVSSILKEGATASPVAEPAP
jgi:hypothetical protein